MHERDPKRVYIFDTTNRDGEQATKGAVYGIESKLLIATSLAEANVDRIEAGFPISSQADFEAVQTIARNVHGPMIFGLARTVVGDYGDVRAAYKAVQDAEYKGIHVFSVMFDPNSLAKYGLTKENVIKDSVRAVAYARKLLGDSGQVEFSFQNATNTPLEYIVEGYKHVVEVGSNVVNVPDTVGYSHPDEIDLIIRTLRNELPNDVMISIHCHDDLGLGVSNSLAAVKAGADIVECTINGIGERAGNAAMEEVVMNIVTRRDRFNGRTIGVKTEMLNPLSKLIAEHYQMPVQENKAIVGANAFRHRSGIHQHGMIIGGVYEIMDPKKVGWDGEGYGLTARSGYAGVEFRLRGLGYTIPPDSRKKIMPMYKEIADEKRIVGNEDLVYLMDQFYGNKDERYKFIDMAISKRGGSDDYIATVTLDVNGKKVSSKRIRGSGKSAIISKTNGNGKHHQGAIDALYTAIDNLIEMPTQLHLVSYDPINIGVGSNAVAEVTVILSEKQNFDGKIRPFEGMYVGRARHVDTLTSSAMAYLDALNKVVRTK